MATLELRGDEVIVHLHGFDKVRALRGSLSVPLSHISGVRTHPKEAFFDDVIVDASSRGVGVYQHGKVCVGTIDLADGRSFYDVRHPERALAIDLVREPLKHIVVELDDETPEEAAQRILRALAPGEDLPWLVGDKPIESIEVEDESVVQEEVDLSDLDRPPSESGVREQTAPPAVVVGVDMSPLTGHLLQSVRDLLHGRANAELHIVHVRPPRPLPSELSGASTVMQDIDLEIRLKRELDQLAESLFGSTDWLRVTTHLRVGNAADEIPRLARQVEADLIVVEAHGRKGLERVFHRSVAAQLARNAPCSVLTIRPRVPDPDSLS